MNTNDYIKELQSHLSVLDKAKKKEIIEEIKSYIEESSADYDLLVERFGTPTELSQSYLEDMPIQESTRSKLWISTKRYIKTMLISLFVIVILVAIVIYFVTKDPYNYSEYNAKSIESKIEAPWVEYNNIDKISFAQSKAVVYWSNEDKVSLSCTSNECQDDDGNLIDCYGAKDGKLFITKSKCYLKLPKQKMDIGTYQSKVIFVEPNEEMILDSKQSRISIAIKDSKYRYIFDGEQSDFDNFSSHKDGILIKGKFYQSKISPYDY